MSLCIDKGNFGDSTRNKANFNYKSPRHVFSGAGENVQYYSDSESTDSRKSKTRYINSAICVEKIESSQSVVSFSTESSCEVVTPHPHTSYSSNSTPFLSGRESISSASAVKRISCRIPGTEPDLCEGTDQTPRGNCTYRDNGADTFRLSVASLSTTTTAKEERDRNEEKKQEVFKQWLARKEQEKREKARLEKMQRQAAPTVTAEQRQEAFHRWLEQKRVLTEKKRADKIMTEYNTTAQIETERAKHERKKMDKLNVWIQKKEEEMKAMKTREERRAARIAIEAEKKRVNGERAYRDWLRTSKSKPLPVPLNQGELSMRGSVSQLYINPIPWKTTIN